jgi:hypothetical protein
LVNSDRYYEDRFDVILDDFPPQSTAILAVNWHHVEYYLPDYTLLPVDIVSGEWLHHRQGEGRVSVQSLGLTPDADGKVRVVIFDDKLTPFNDAPDLVQVIELAHGGRMEVFTLSADQVLYVEPTFGVVGRE